ncbi:EF hand domain-containing protein [Cryptosporidium andersoni]|uniref:EF hand domain-containing protein n=1 Tax=Cryptosporidium andersoni TaxID=117008 RepID=A0A1J4MNT9_9CRYT|nr:EF hand domain-containing protein [Cryptosporidium andersoni]
MAITRITNYAKAGNSTSNVSSLLRLANNEELYKEWLKTLTINEEVLLERFNNLIKLIDKDSNNVLDESEITEWLEYLGNRSTFRDAAAEFNFIDKNKDNIVEFEEFIYHFSPESQRDEEDDGLHDFYIRLFFEMDLNKDEVLEINEYYNLVHDYTLSGEFYKRIHLFIESNDINHDGVLDKDELRKLKENKDILTEFTESLGNKNGDALQILGINVEDFKEINATILIRALKNKEMRDLIQDSYNQLLDVLKTHENATKQHANATSLPTKFINENFVIYIQSGLTDYGEIFRYPQDYFAETGHKEYGMTSEECTEKFGDNEKEKETEHDEYDHDHEIHDQEDEQIDDEQIGDEQIDDEQIDDENFDTDQDEVEITDDMIQKLISLMGEQGKNNLFGDISGDQTAEMDSVLQMLSSMVNSKGSQYDLDNLDNLDMNENNPELSEIHHEFDSELIQERDEL